MYHIEQKIIKNQVLIESWFREKVLHIPPVFTSSVDLRNSGFKIAPVDTNIFPAGFNNLNPTFYPLAIQAFQTTLITQAPSCRRILIIPESHTRNLFYYESLATLAHLIHQAGYEVKMGSLILAENSPPHEVTLPSEKSIVLHPVLKDNNRLKTKDFDPCLIILNNDLSDGIPDILKNIQQTILPSPLLGWHTRSKFTHFNCYDKLVNEFSKIINIDPWEISTLYDIAEDIDLSKSKSRELLLEKTEILFNRINEKYREHKIDMKPFVFIKADAGTYGVAVMPILKPEDILTLNRKQRQSMSSRKGGKSVDKIIIQEGVYTSEYVGPHQAVSEPVVYLIGQQVIGGFYRIHQSRENTENLNTPGMEFEPLAFDECCNNPDFKQSPESHKNRFYSYSVIARIAAMATRLELQQINAADKKNIG